MKINKIYIVSLCALFLSSCNNFLDEQPTGTMYGAQNEAV